MTRIRFSLRLLFVVATLLIVFFGYSQIRRKQILEMCEGLKVDRYVFEVPNGLLDKVIWQRKPTVGNVFSPAGWGRRLYRTKYGERYNNAVDEADKEEIARLETLGVVNYGTTGLPATEIIRMSRHGLTK